MVCPVAAAVVMSVLPVSAAAVASAPRVRSNEMVLFDIETNIFPIEVIEFGAIIVDKFVSHNTRKRKGNSGKRHTPRQAAEPRRTPVLARSLLPSLSLVVIVCTRRAMSSWSAVTR